MNCKINWKEIWYVIKNLLFAAIIAGLIVFMISCSTMEPATAYHYNGKSDSIGQVVDVIETHGYSIITVDNMLKPYYIKGKMPKDIVGEYASVAKIGKKEELVISNQRYLIDQNPR